MSAEKSDYSEAHPPIGEEVIPESSLHGDMREGARLLNAMHHGIRTRRTQLQEQQGDEYNPDSPILLTKDEIIRADRELHDGLEDDSLSHGHINFEVAEPVAIRIGELILIEDPDCRTTFYQYIEPPEPTRK